MPILKEDKQILEATVASFDIEDSVAIAKLVYETIADARMTKTNPQGLSFEAATSLGRLIFDKTPWAMIPKIEEALGDKAIRLPIIKSCDTVFRSQLPTVLPKLPDAEKQVLAHFLSKLDSNELMSLVLLVYETLVQAKFTVDPKLFSGVHPFTKFLQAGWTWEDLKSAPPLVQGICLPLIDACHDFMRPALPMIFRIDVVQTPEEKAVEDAATPSPAEITPEIVATNEASDSAVPGEGATDPNPFADLPADNADQAVATQQSNGAHTVAEPATSEDAEPQEASSEDPGALEASPEGAGALEASSEGAEALEASSEGTEALEASPEGTETLEASPEDAEALETPPEGVGDLAAPPEGVGDLVAAYQRHEQQERQRIEAPSESSETKTSEVAFEVMPENGARTLSKKERRELRRKQREGAGT